MNIILLGPPGSGKGILGKLISDYLDIPDFTASQILKEEVKKASEEGRIIKTYMESGELVPDNITLITIENFLHNLESDNGFIIDGFPRTLPQAEHFSKVIDMNLVLNFKVSKEKILERISQRRVCENCGAVYHLKFIKPKLSGVCDACGGKIIARKDDTPQVVEKRLEVYEEKTLPLVKYYENKNILKNINSDSDTPKINLDRCISTIIDSEKPKYRILDGTTVIQKQLTKDAIAHTALILIILLSILTGTFFNIKSLFIDDSNYGLISLQTKDQSVILATNTNSTDTIINIDPNLKEKINIYIPDKKSIDKIRLIPNNDDVKIEVDKFFLQNKTYTHTINDFEKATIIELPFSKSYELFDNKEILKSQIKVKNEKDLSLDDMNIEHYKEYTEISFKLKNNPIKTAQITPSDYTNIITGNFIYNLSEKSNLCYNCSDCNEAILNSTNGWTIALANNIIADNSCLELNNKQNLTFDCDSNKLIGPGGNLTETGINITNSNNITIQNCYIEEFKTDIKITNSNNSYLNNLILNNSKNKIYINNNENTSIINSNFDEHNYEWVDQIRLYYSGMINITNITVRFNGYHMNENGIYAENITKLYVDNSNFNNIEDHAIRGYFINYFEFKNSLIQYTTDSLDILGDVGKIHNNTFYENTFAITTSIENVSIYDNKFIENGRAIRFYDNNMLIYNNYFENNSNYFQAINIGGDIKLNTTNQTNTTIINTTNYGGNYWGKSTFTDSYSLYCIDLDKNNVCDEPYTTQYGFTDYHPLTRNTQIYCHNCSHCNELIESHGNNNKIKLLFNINTNTSCININNKENLTLDCNNLKIKGTDTDHYYETNRTTGITITNTTQSSIINCNIDNFHQGIKFLNSSSNQVYNIKFTNNYYDSPAIASGSIELKNSHLNNFTNNLGINESFGFWLDSSNNNIINNYIMTAMTATTWTQESGGIRTENSRFNTFSNLNISHSWSYCAYEQYSEYNNYTNINCTQRGIITLYSNNTLISKLRITDFTSSPLFSSGIVQIISSNNIKINNVNINDTYTLLSNNEGIRIYNSQNTTIINSFLYELNTAILSSGSTNFKNNTIVNSNIGIEITDGNTNIINNYFSNEQNLKFNVTSPPSINLNTTNQTNITIINTLNYGGNYWATPNNDGYSQTCNDLDRNNVCDEPYNISDIIDNYPLTTNQDIRCHNCSECTTLIANYYNDTTYILSRNITTSNQTCIDIGIKRNITFDCQNHQITSDNTYNGIDLNGAKESTIQNCIVKSFSMGLYCQGGLQTNNIINNSVFNYNNNGIYMSPICSNVTIINTVANYNTQKGIMMTDNLYHILNNVTANYNSVGIDLSSGSQNPIIVNSETSYNTNIGVNYQWENFNVGLLENHTAIGNIYAIKLYDAWKGIIKNNYFENNQYSFYISEAPDSGWTYTKLFNNTFKDYNTLYHFQTIYSTLPYTFYNNTWLKANGQGFSQTCLDSNKDKICDNPYEIGLNLTDNSSITNHSCSDGIKNQDESNTDCGGSCNSCATTGGSGGSSSPSSINYIPTPTTPETIEPEITNTQDSSGTKTKLEINTTQNNNTTTNKTEQNIINSQFTINIDKVVNPNLVKEINNKLSQCNTEVCEIKLITTNYNIIKDIKIETSKEFYINQKLGVAGINKISQNSNDQNIKLEITSPNLRYIEVSNLEISYLTKNFKGIADSYCTDYPCKIPLYAYSKTGGSLKIEID